MFGFRWFGFSCLLCFFENLKSAGVSAGDLAGWFLVFGWFGHELGSKEEVEASKRAALSSVNRNQESRHIPSFVVTA